MKKLLKTAVLALALPLLVTTPSKAMMLSFKDKIDIASNNKQNELVLINKNNLADMPSAINLVREGKTLFLYDNNKTKLKELITKLSPKRVTIIGSPNSLPTFMDAYLKQFNLDVTRLNEKNRYLTNQKTIHSVNTIVIKKPTLENIIMAADLSKHANLPIELVDKAPLHTPAYSLDNLPAKYKVENLKDVLSILNSKTTTPINVRDLNSLMHINDLFASNTALTYDKATYNKIKKSLNLSYNYKDVINDMITRNQVWNTVGNMDKNYTNDADNLLREDDNTPHIWKFNTKKLYTYTNIGGINYLVIDNYKTLINYYLTNALPNLYKDPIPALIDKDVYDNEIRDYQNKSVFGNIAKGYQYNLKPDPTSVDNYMYNNKLYIKTSLIPAYYFNVRMPKFDASQVERFKTFRKDVNTLLIKSRALYKTTKEAQIYAFCNYMTSHYPYDKYSKPGYEPPAEIMPYTVAYDALTINHTGNCQAYTATTLEACRQLGIKAYPIVLNDIRHIMLVANLGDDKYPDWHPIEATGYKHIQYEISNVKNIFRNMKIDKGLNKLIMETY